MEPSPSVSSSSAAFRVAVTSQESVANLTNAQFNALMEEVVSRCTTEQIIAELHRRRTEQVKQWIECSKAGLASITVDLVITEYTPMPDPRLAASGWTQTHLGGDRWRLGPPPGAKVLPYPPADQVDPVLAAAGWKQTHLGGDLVRYELPLPTAARLTRSLAPQRAADAAAPPARAARSQRTERDRRQADE